MTAENQRIKFAVVGCGHIGKRHAEMIVRNPESELVALVDVKSKSVLNIDQYHVPFYSSLEELLNADVDIDVVNVATPNGFHCEHALKALEEKKHVVIEKPLALKKLDAEKIIYKALNVHRHVFAVMQNRYSPPSVWIKEMVDSGRL
jgi:predicted dehydrogenase